MNKKIIIIVSIIIVVLIIVASIIGSLMLSLGAMVYNTANEEIQQSDVGSNFTAAEIEIFNSNFLAHEGSNVDGNTVVALFNKVLANNTSSNEKVDIFLNNNSLKILTEIDRTATYDVELEYDSTGRIETINITEN